MKTDIDFPHFAKRLFDLLEAHLGPTVELVYHDLTNEYSHTITDIRNGNITGRELGGTGDEHGLLVLKGVPENTSGDVHNEICCTKDGKTLRCSTLFIYDRKGKAVASICINQDITQTIGFEEYLRQLNGAGAAQSRVITPDVTDLLDKLISDAQLAVGRHCSTMTKEDKINFIRHLDSHGAFLIAKSGPTVCKALHISRYSLYKYLDMVRGNQSGIAKNQQKTACKKGKQKV